MNSLGHRNGNGVPDWMAAAGIGAGEYLSVTKPQLRVLQRPCEKLKTRVWATVILHTAGYKGEEAFTLRNGHRVPLTPRHISSELHAAAKEYYTGAGLPLSAEQVAALREPKERVRKTLADLEEDGVVERRTAKGKPVRELSTDQRKRLSNGALRIFGWLRPKKADTEGVRAEWEALQAGGAPIANCNEGVISGPPTPSISLILKVFNWSQKQPAKMTPSEYTKKVESAYLAAKKVFDAEMAREGGATEPPAGAAAGAAEGVAAAPPEGVATGPSTSLKGSVERKGKPTSSSSPEGQEQAAASTTTSPSLEIQQPTAKTNPIEAALADTVRIAEADVVNRLRDGARSNLPDATDEEVATFVRHKWPQARGGRNPVGLLIAAVAKCFEGTDSPCHQLRRQIAAAQQRDAERRAEAEAADARDPAERLRYQIAWCERRANDLTAPLPDRDEARYQIRQLRKQLEEL